MRVLIAVAALSVLCMSCATKGYVNKEVGGAETRSQEQINDIKRMVEETQTEIRDLAKELDVKIEGVEQTTRDLNERAAKNADMIAKLGYVSFKKTFSDAEAYFKSDSAELSDAAVEELDKFAQLIKGQNKRLYIEVQGHTDNRGSEKHNLLLGEKRALAVRDLLYKKHDIPLHLMSVISMGATDPVADNDNRDGRAMNRRVVLVVRIQI